MEGQLKELRASHSIVSRQKQELELKASCAQSELLIERDRCFALSGFVEVPRVGCCAATAYWHLLHGR